MDNKLIIIAGNLRQAEDFALEHKLKKEDFLYVHKWEQLMGKRNFKFVCVGTYYLNENHKLLRDIRSRGEEIIGNEKDFLNAKSTTTPNQLKSYKYFKSI